jgi:hypothetical protein
VDHALGDAAGGELAVDSITTVEDRAGTTFVGLDAGWNVLEDIDVAFMPMNIPPERMSPADAAACTKILNPKVVYVYHYDQDFAARAVNPSAPLRGLPGGVTIAQSLLMFRDAMKGTSTDVRSGRWY